MIDFSKLPMEGVFSENGHYTPNSAEGERCKCGQPATHKVEEVTDAPRHPFTRYLCCKHFSELMGDFAEIVCMEKGKL